MALFAYLQQTQRLLRDQKVELFNLFDLIPYVNQARNRIAAEGQCCRVVPISSGSFATLAVGSGGSGYTSPPTVTISPPDAIGVGFTPATATCTISGGAVNGFTLTNIGSGYVNPSVTLSGGGGSGATAAFTLTPFMKTTANQEVYTFASFNNILPTGLSQILAVQTVAVAWGSVKPVLRQRDWSSFQAYWRAQNPQSTNWPDTWAQLGDGTQGQVYLNPIPSQTMQMEWDCFCLPSPLTNDTGLEAIPYPWTDGIPYFAAWMASIEAKDPDRANFFESQYRRMVKDSRWWSTPAFIPDFYEGPF